MDELKTTWKSHKPFVDEIAAALPEHLRPIYKNFADACDKLLSESVAPKWIVELKYKYRGLPKPRFENLGLFEGDYDVAADKANKKAEAWIETLNDVESWCIRIRPSDNHI